MFWFVSVFFLIVISLFLASLYMIKLRQRREISAELDEKLTRLEKKWDPKFNFFVNLFGWIFAILVIFYIYLG